MRRILCILSILLFALVVFVVMQAGARKPRPLADTVTVTFLGYTNDSSGTRIGLFKVANPSPVSVDLRKRHEVQVETEGSWTSQGLQQAATAIVMPKQEVLLQIGAPGGKQRWRVWLNYEDHKNLATKIALGLNRVGLPISVPDRSYSACSAPVNP